MILKLMDNRGVARELVKLTHSCKEETALHEAAHTGQLYITKWLLRRGADVNKESKNGATALSIAVRSKNVALVDLLLDFGADPFRMSNRNETAIDVAQRAADEVVSERLREEHNGVVEEKLQAVFEAGQDEQEAVRLLRKADRQGKSVKQIVNTRTADYQQSPLHLAVLAGNYRLAELLLSQGAAIDAADKTENTPLHYAFQKGFLAVGELLVEHGAGIMCANTRGTSAFHYLVGQRWEDESAPCLAIMAAGSQTSNLQLEGSDEVVRRAQDHMNVPLFRYLLDLMLKMGQDINVSDKSQETPLHRAVLAGNAATVRYLLSRGAEPNKCTSRGETSLHYAARNNDLQVVMLLLQSNADPLMCGPNGQPKHVTTSQQVIDTLAGDMGKRESKHKSPFGKKVRHHGTVEDLPQEPTLRDTHYDEKYKSNFGAVFRWESRMSPSGRPYYCDLRNRNIVWELPEDVDLDEVLHGDAADEVPQWERRIHFSGEFYYVNNATKQVFWQLPEDVNESDIVCFDVDVVEEEVTEFKLDVNDENDPAFHYASIAEDPRFKRLLAKHCPSVCLLSMASPS